MNRVTNRTVRSLGMSAEQAHILMVLWVEGPLKTGELQRMVGLSSGTLTGALDRMEKAELVHRLPDPEDGRAWRIEPARAIERKRGELETRLVDMEEACFRVLTAKERRQLFELLEKVTASLPEVR